MDVSPQMPLGPSDASQPTAPLPAYVAVTPWGPASALAATVVILAVSVLAPMLVASVLAAHLGGAALAMGSPAFLALMALSQIVMGGAAWWLAAQRGGRRQDVLALRPARGGWKVYAIAILAMLVCTTAFNLFRQYVLGHDIYADLKLLAPLFRQPYWPLAFLIVVVGAPLAEEWLFRGFLQSALAKSRLGFVGAACLATLIWTALHAYSIPGMVLVAILGVVFSWMLWWSGSLRVPIAAHAVNNAIACLYLQFGPPLG
jgi:uncharacterized protein